MTTDTQPDEEAIVWVNSYVNQTISAPVTLAGSAWNSTLSQCIQSSPGPMLKKHSIRK